MVGVGCPAVHNGVRRMLFSLPPKSGVSIPPRITLFSLLGSACFFSAIGRKPVRTSNGMSEWLPSSHLRAIPRVVERVGQVRSFILPGTLLFGHGGGAARETDGGAAGVEKPGGSKFRGGVP